MQWEFMTITKIKIQYKQLNKINLNLISNNKANIKNKPNLI
jgi:hypothetical protein